MANFCQVCGYVCDEIPFSFDKDTGKPITIPVCSSKKCGHRYGNNRIEHKYVFKLFGSSRCKECGEVADTGM